MTKRTSTERTEADQWRVLQRYMHPRTKHVGKVDLAKFTRNATNKTGWNAKDLDRWLEAVTKEKHIQMATGTEGKVRQAATTATRMGPVGEQEQMREAVTRWVRKNTEGQVSAAHVTAEQGGIHQRGGGEQASAETGRAPQPSDESSEDEAPEWEERMRKQYP